MSNRLEGPRWQPRNDFTIEAIQWLGRYEELPLEWRASDMVYPSDSGTRLIVRSPEGPESPRPGDYVVRGVAGQYEVVRQATFERMWARVEQSSAER